MSKHFLIGMDVGSTTVKAVVTDAATEEVLWQDYHRHDTKQPEKSLEFLKRFEEEIDDFNKESKPHVTALKKLGQVDFVTFDGISDLYSNLSRYTAVHGDLCAADSIDDHAC